MKGGQTNAPPSAKRHVAFALGAGGFAVLQLFLNLSWELWFQPSTLETPWFLGSPRAIVVTQVALGALGLARALRRGSTWRIRIVEAGWTTVGVMVALTTAFFWIGPERLMVGPTRLWPVVLSSSFLLLAPAILAGTLLGGHLSRMRPASEDSPK
jgi:uncharacterized membrane protein